MICADASLGAKWLFPEEQHAQRALALLRDTLARGERIIAPPFLAAEVTNIIRQRMRRDGVSLARARELLGQFLALPIAFSAPPAIYDEALTIADTYALPAAYDAHYIALARATGCTFWTDDQRLLRGLAGRLPFVRWIGEYVAGEVDL